MSTRPTDIPETAVTHEPCCSSHNVPMTCETYRRTHFVQVRPCCSVDAQRLDAEIGLSDEAWIDVVGAVGWDESNKLWPVLRTALAAAIPAVLASRDSETAEPELIMGTKPDGSPWVVSAEFDGPTVRVDGHGALRLHGKAISPRTAYKLATGMLAAIAWLENDGAAKVEAATSLRGEQ